LIKAGPGIAGAEQTQRSTMRRRLIVSALINYKDLVACTVHFQEGSSHHRIVAVRQLFPAHIVYLLQIAIGVLLLHPLTAWTFVAGICSLHKLPTTLNKLPLGRVMRHIMVLNAKGGCGKSTLATNIASYFATEGASVALADYDPQRSSLDWLDRRPDNRAPIAGVAGFESGLRRVPRTADFVIIDAPARSHGKELIDLVKHAETIVVPVLPSTIDMQATSTFLQELQALGKIERKQAKIGAVANRVRDNTLIFDDLDEYLTKARVPYVAALREAQNYVRAYTRGIGIFELPEYLAWPDWEEWKPLTSWLRSVRSQP
jgi:chromosome partitioning protein